METMQDRAHQIFGDHPKNVHGVEEAFAYSADGMTIRGRYDAIFHEDGRWLIVDWKTGAPPTKKFQNKYLPGYATQLEVYRRAFAQSHDLPVEEVEAELVFLGGADTKPDQRRVRLDDLRELLDDYDFERDWKRVIKLIQPSIEGTRADSIAHASYRDTKSPIRHTVRGPVDTDTTASRLPSTN